MAAAEAAGLFPDDDDWFPGADLVAAGASGSSATGCGAIGSGWDQSHAAGPECCGSGSWEVTSNCNSVNSRHGAAVSGLGGSWGIDGILRNWGAATAVSNRSDDHGESPAISFFQLDL